VPQFLWTTLYVIYCINSWYVSVM